MMAIHFLLTLRRKIPKEYIPKEKKSTQFPFQSCQLEHLTGKYFRGEPIIVLLWDLQTSSYEYSLRVNLKSF